MRGFSSWAPSVCALVLMGIAGLGALPAAAQKPLEPEQKADDKSNIAVVEVTPGQATAAIGGKVQFKAVAKDKAGNTLPDAVKYWDAAAFDAAGAAPTGGGFFFFSWGCCVLWAV